MIKISIDHKSYEDLSCWYVKKVSRNLINRAKRCMLKLKQENYKLSSIEENIINKLSDKSWVKMLLIDEEETFKDNVVKQYMNSAHSNHLINECIKGIVSYRFLDNIVDKNKHKIALSKISYHLGVKVCPYCNTQYVYAYTLENNGNNNGMYYRYRGQLDHYYNKNTYPLFSMSLWNMVPSCNSCNHIKSDSNIKILNPYHEGFGDESILYVDTDDSDFLDVLSGNSVNFNLVWLVRYDSKKCKK